MARTLIGSIAPNIHGINSADSLASDDELILYDSSSSANRKTKLSDFCAGIKSLIPTIPYVFDYEDANFAKIKAAYIEGRPSSMNCRGNMLQLTSCTEESAEFYGFSMASNLGIISIKPWYAKVNSDGTKTYSASNSYFPFPGSFYFKLTESNGVLSANDSPHDFAFVDIYGMPVTIEYNNTLYDYREHKRVGSSYVQYFYAITVEDDTTVVHELTRTTSGSTVTWAHRTVSAAGASGGVGVFEVTLTTQNGVSVADKTFEQVKAAVEDGSPVLKVHSDGALLWFFLLDKSPTEIDFVGLYDEQIIAYLTVKQDNTWEATVAARVTAEMLSSLNDKIGNIGQLTTTDKTNLVAAVNEVKQTTDGKQDKLTAGDNITITEDGTISATGGGDIKTVESQLVDIPSKLSQLTNDAGYLTLDTLPKYDGSVT